MIVTQDTQPRSWNHVAFRPEMLPTHHIPAVRATSSHSYVLAGVINLVIVIGKRHLGHNHHKDYLGSHTQVDDSITTAESRATTISASHSSARHPAMIAQPTLPSVESDTSICPHLRALVERRRATPPAQVKTEPGESTTSNGTPATASPAKDTSARALAEKRFSEVVRWGALDQGAKRKKVSG